MPGVRSVYDWCLPKSSTPCHNSVTDHPPRPQRAMSPTSVVVQDIGLANKRLTNDKEKSSLDAYLMRVTIHIHSQYYIWLQDCNFYDEGTKFKLHNESLAAQSQVLMHHSSSSFDGPSYVLRQGIMYTKVSYHWLYKEKEKQVSDDPQFFHNIILPQQYITIHPYWSSLNYTNHNTNTR